MKNLQVYKKIQQHIDGYVRIQTYFVLINAYIEDTIKQVHQV